MAQKVTRGLDARITGPVTGQVAVGDRNVQVTAGPGAVVTVVPPEDRVVPRRRPPPVLLRPRPFPGLLGREADLARVREAGRARLPVNVHGEPGIGKTALLRHLAHLPADAPDGLVYLRVPSAPALDVLQAMFEALCEVDRPVKATDAQLRHLLGDADTAILLDDVDLDREGLDAVVGIAPRSWFVAASEDRLLWGEGMTVRLGGLTPEAGVELFERGLGRSLLEKERPAAHALCDALEGHPLRILRAATSADREDLPVAALAATPAAAASFPRDDEERGVLGVMAALRGASMEPELVGTLTGSRDPEGVLRSLASRDLVHEEEGGYRSVLPGWPADAERVVEGLTAWAEERRGDHRALRAARDALTIGFRWARAANRAPTLLRLARALDEHLTLECRWGLWESVLEAARGAAAAVGDAREQAWALHQLGTRALCLEHGGEARRLLGEALNIRERVGDEAGAAVTRHNLGLLAPQTEAGRKGEPPPRPHPLRRALTIAVALAVLAGGGMAARELLRHESPDLPPADETATEGPDRGGGEATGPTDPGDPDPDDPSPGEAGIRVPGELRLPTFETPDSDDVARPVFEDRIVVRSAGSAPLEVTAALVERFPSDWLVDAEDCRRELEPEEACAIRVVFAPTGGDDRSTRLVIEHNAPEAVTRVGLIDARPPIG